MLAPSLALEISVCFQKAEGINGQCIAPGIFQSHGWGKTSKAFLFAWLVGSLRRNNLSTGWGTPMGKVLVFAVSRELETQRKTESQQLFLVKTRKSPSSLNTVKLRCLESEAQKDSPALVSTMSKVFSKERNSLTRGDPMQKSTGSARSR